VQIHRQSSYQGIHAFRIPKQSVLRAFHNLDRISPYHAKLETSISHGRRKGFWVLTIPLMNVSYCWIICFLYTSPRRVRPVLNLWTEPPCCIRNNFKIDFSLREVSILEWSNDILVVVYFPTEVNNRSCLMIVLKFTYLRRNVPSNTSPSVSANMKSSFPPHMSAKQALPLNLRV